MKTLNDFTQYQIQDPQLITGGSIVEETAEGI